MSVLCYQATGLAQLLLVASVALSPSSQLSMRDHWGSDSVKDWWCGGHHVESEVIMWRVRSEADLGLLLEAFQLTQSWASG